MSSEAGPSRIKPSSSSMTTPSGTSGASSYWSAYILQPVFSVLWEADDSIARSLSTSKDAIFSSFPLALVRSSSPTLGYGNLLFSGTNGASTSPQRLRSRHADNEFRMGARERAEDSGHACVRFNNAAQEDPHTPLDDRKLGYIPMENPRTPSSTIKEVSRFLSKNRSKNEASNREEFLNATGTTSCARTDAKHQDRDLQMKYDIAKNEDGPLRRTMKDFHAEAQQPTVTSSATKDAQIHPGLDDRLKTVETHLAIRYVPSMPRDFLARLKFLEDHIIRLEKDYPPWAALHFNQPNRGWPPPPRSNPIIVPPYLRDSASEIKPAASDASNAPLRGEKSSLHKAVMERLEVQQAMGELATPSKD
ncbi:hypothetical protein AB1N83_005469 [Pleurotus pulmonarius]